MSAESQPRVSVVLPVYNGSGTVERAIQSIRDQTLEEWELVIYDDGSTDASHDLCKELAARDDRIRVIRGVRNRGLGAAMNRLVSEARADLIAVQEQDDESVSTRLATQVAVLDSDSRVGLVTGVAQWTSDGAPIALFPGLLAHGGSYPSDMVTYLLVEQCKVVNACVMFRKRCLGADRSAFDEDARMSVDWQFFIDVAHRERIVGVNEVLVHVDRTPSRTSLTANKQLQGSEARRCLRIIRRRYLHDPHSPVTRSTLRKAWATQLNLQGRWRSGVPGLGLVMVGWALDPTRADLRRSAQDMIGRGAAKVRARVSPSAGT